MVCPDLRMSGESCLNLAGIVPEQLLGSHFSEYQHSANWKNTGAVITCDTRFGDEGNLKIQIKNPTF